MSGPAPVLVTVVNFNGGALTLECLEHLAATDYRPVRILLVDNGSDDGVAEEVRRRYPDVDVEELGGNLGFAAGSNVGLRRRRPGEHVALVNNDAFVSPDWLRPLVEVIESDGRVGAACPKILYRGPFVEVGLRSDVAVGVRLHSILGAGGELLGRGAQLVRGFALDEPVNPDRDGVRVVDERAVLRVPVALGSPLPGRASLTLSAARATRAVLSSGEESVDVGLDPSPSTHDLVLAGAPVEVINNVGTEPAQHGYWRDRGWLEVDAGQYDVPTDVPAWSGGAVVLSGRYLDDVGLFDERLFLYYEDVELALRGSGDWRYRYVPSSVVQHLHSASAVEGSPFARYHNERNRLLVLARHGTGRGLVAGALRYLLATLSYARRDVLAPLVRREPIRASVVATRVRAFGGFLRLLPGMACDRWSDRPAVR